MIVHILSYSCHERQIALAPAHFRLSVSLPEGIARRQFGLFFGNGELGAPHAGKADQLSPMLFGLSHMDEKWIAPLWDFLTDARAISGIDKQAGMGERVIGKPGLCLVLHLISFAALMIVHIISS
jgi:hypothetical protein